VKKERRQTGAGSMPAQHASIDRDPERHLRHAANLHRAAGIIGRLL
jgi:hypothetical protein